MRALAVRAANMDCPPTGWPESPRIAVKCRIVDVDKIPLLLHQLNDTDLTTLSGRVGQVSHGFAAAIPMDNPYCRCKSRGLQLQSLWAIPAAAAS